MTFDAKEYWERRLQRDFNLVGVGDITMGKAYNFLSYKMSSIVLNRIFNKWLPKVNIKALDVGCGTGFAIKQLMKYPNISVSGMDITESSIQQLSKKFGSVKFYNCDISSDSLSIVNESLNLVVSASVFYHIIDDEKWLNALMNVRKVLAKDGLFIFSEAFPKLSRVETSHQKCRLKSEYQTALNAAGFELVRIVPNYVLMNDPVDTNNIWLRRIWALGLKISRNRQYLSYVWWSIIFPIEWVLTLVMSESPSQEFWICKAV